MTRLTRFVLNSIASFFEGGPSSSSFKSEQCLLQRSTTTTSIPSVFVYTIFLALCLMDTPQTVRAFGCARPELHCDQASCKERVSLPCTDERLVLDSCGCCLVCLRDVDETCGGINDSFGICADGLRCVSGVDANLTFDGISGGVCKESKDGKCANVTCTSKPTPCPTDSYLLINSSTDLNICCPEHQCNCLPSSCPVIKCPKNHHPKVTQIATGIPGSCCDSFECINETESRCRYKDKLYDNGAKWMEDRCSVCNCENGVVHCKAKSCDEKNLCALMFYPEGECCPVCYGCVAPSGIFYNNSVAWKEDECTTCQCIDGKMNCQSEMCQTKCANPRLVHGLCCPICDDGLYNKIIMNEPPQQHAIKQTALKHNRMDQETCHVESNKEYGPEEMWNDGCRQCYCHNGREMCAVLTCPILNCDHPKLLPNQCCPVCADDRTSLQIYRPTVCQAVDGRYHVERESWSLDPCTWCICIKGQVLCQATQCPPTPCSHPVHHIGSCCRTCPGEKNAVALPMSYCYSEDSKTVYAEGQHWFASPCKSCVCHQGKARCFQETCPIVDCLHPLMVKHRCCPVCLGVKNSRTLVCLQNGRTYRDGENWSANACTTCTCVKGMQTCTEKICQIWCARPVHVPGQCCPICEGENHGANEAYSSTQLSLAIVVICATIMVLLVLAIVFLVMAILRQRKYPETSTNTCQSVLSQSFCRGQRPKSTNLELQGMSPCSKPLLDSNELKKLHDQGGAVMKNMV